MTKRQEAAQETRRKLVETARRIVRERGIAATNIDELCKACGVAKGTFYVYFKRKEDVIFELSGMDLGDLLEETKRSAGDIRVRLEHFLVELSSYIEGNSLKLAQEWIRNTAEPDLIGGNAGSIRLTQNLDAINELLADAASQGELRKDAPVGKLAQALLEVLYGEVLCWCTSNGAFALAGRTRQFCGSFLEPMISPYRIDKENVQ